ncbi:MAG: leucine zipper domain-containing protein, partial [Dehalococcoidia bacterium]
MPWKETCVMDQRIELIGDWLKKEHSIVELSRMYGVSRNTVYKWITRYGMEGLEGLEERPRVPGSHPNATARPQV